MRPPCSHVVFSCFVLAQIAVLSGSSAAQSPPPTANEILDALRAPALTRGIRQAPTGEPATNAVPSAAPGTQKLLETLVAKSRTRGLSEPELDQLGVLAEKRPSIDLTIYFDFNSAVISPRALPTVMALGQALSNGEVRSAKFLLAGHTDAKGNAAYNQALSERRAQAVRRYLVEHFKLPSEKVAAVGFGKQRLKIPKQPFADENRRVQVVNLGDANP